MQVNGAFHGIEKTRPALAEVRNDETGTGGPSRSATGPAVAMRCRGWKLNAVLWGGSGRLAAPLRSGMGNEASVPTRAPTGGRPRCLPDRAQVTYLICAPRAEDMISGRGARP
ncbi:unnamed protein product [Boreogadus saida]